jgi:hypothetical protein
MIRVCIRIRPISATTLLLLGLLIVQLSGWYFHGDESE